MRVCQYTQRFAALRSGGLKPQTLTRSTQLKCSTNVYTKHVSRHYAKPLLSAALISFILCFSVVSGVVGALAG